MKNQLLLLMCLVITISGVRAEKIKFKPITKKELSVEKCDFYPEAKAMILEKRGEIDFEFVTDGLVYRYGEGVRIKVLDDQEKNVGNVKIRLYVPENNLKGPSEKIIFLSGFSYHLENGEIVKTKLEKVDVFNNRLNENWMEVSFAIPGVKKGTVVEYSYVKESSYFTNLSPWYFQEDIPTCYNELTYTIPEYFDFQSRVMGNLHEMERGEKWVNDLIGGGNHRSKQINIKVKNVPPVENEPFVSNACDLPMRLAFQLVSIHIPGQPIMQVAGTYEQFNQKLMEMERFGHAVRKGSFPKEVTAAVVGKSEMETAVYLFNWFKTAVTWNGTLGVVQSKTSRECLRDKTGDVADINLTLVSLLRTCGLEAHPVLISTRGNGVIHPVYPNYDDFNYVICAIKIGDAYYLCDATSKASFGFLPQHCLNGQGWLAAEGGGEMIPLQGRGADVSSVITTLRLEGGKLVGEVAVLDKEYSAMRIVEKYTKDGAEKFEESLRASYVDWNFSDYRFSPEEYGLKQLFKLDRPCERTDVLYIQPFLYGVSSEPLFKRDTRLSVVDFPYGIQQNFAVTIEVPEGYEVEEIPQAVSYLLSNKGALFTFNAFGGENKVTLALSFTLRKLMYVPNEYPELKDFFDKWAELAKTVIILKKKV